MKSETFEDVCYLRSRRFFLFHQIPTKNTEIFSRRMIKLVDIVLASFINAEIPVWDEESQLTSAMAYIPKKTEFN